jgi:DNA-binding NarL/FixJ family response regulator
VRIVIADDEGLLRAGLTRLLTDAGFQIAGVCGDAETLLALVAARRPDVAIVDIRMPPGDGTAGLDAAQEIRRRHADVGVLVLSHLLELRYALRLLEEAPQRAGYLLKERVSDVEALADALRRVADGECVIDPQIVSRLLARRRGPLRQLTDREREVLGLIAEGRSNTAIGQALFLSPKTVETHISHIFAKLDLRDSPQHHPRVLAVLEYLRAS